MATHREKIIRELISTEVTYVESLTWLQENFREPLQMGHIITEEEDQIIFLNSATILNLHKPLLENLQKAMEDAEKEERIETVCIGKILADLIPWLRMYTAYINGTQEGSEMVDKLNKTNDNFRYALIGCCAEMFSGIMGISSLRQVPVQRIPRYVLLLKDLLKHTEKSHPDYEQLTQALAGFQQIATEINEKKRHHENQVKLQHFDEIIKGNRDMLLRDCPDKQKHIWKKTRISAPTTCGDTGCGSVIGFGKKYFKCEVCHIVCHKVCADELPQTCSLAPTLIKYNRLLIKDEDLQCSRVKMGSGKKMEAANASKFILFSDCMLVCELSHEHLEIEAVIWWLSVSTNRKAVIAVSSHDECAFSITSPTDGDIYTFTCKNAKEQQEWVNQLMKTMAEWTTTFRKEDPENDDSPSVLPPLAEFDMFSIAHTVPVFSKKGKTFTAFVVDFKFNGEEYSILKRFRDFDKLHKHLKSALPKCDIPSLPPKRFFSDNTEESFVKNRCARLERFLNRVVVQVPSVLDVPCFREFLFVEESAESQNEKAKKDRKQLGATLRTNDKRNSLHKVQRSRSDIHSPSQVSAVRQTTADGTENPVQRRPRRSGGTEIPTPASFNHAELVEDVEDEPTFVKGTKVIIISQNEMEDTCKIYFGGTYCTVPRSHVKISGAIRYF